MRLSLFWDVTRRRSVAAYRRFGQHNDTNFKGLPSRIDLLFFLLFPYPTIFFFMFPLLHSLVLCLLYTPPYLHSSSVSPACSFSSFLFLIPFFLRKFGCQSPANFDILACVKVKECQPIVLQQYRVVSKYGWNHKVVITSGSKRCVRFCGHYNLTFYRKH